MTVKIVPEMTYNVLSGTLSLYTTIPAECEIYEHYGYVIYFRCLKMVLKLSK